MGVGDILSLKPFPLLVGVMVVVGFNYRRLCAGFTASCLTPGHN